MQTRFILIGALLAALAVALGAFGAHALKAMLLAAGRYETYQTAVQYHFYHALGLIALGALGQLFPERRLAVAGWLMLLGCLLFSGSLYVLCFTGATWLGAVTPLGGLAFIGAWGWLAYAFRRA
jgi:uncharacterized membrane protein YgdD (TMEM256/DUF423 family)